MQKIPLWKIDREFKRLRSQVAAVVEHLYEPGLREQQYRRRLHPDFLTTGQQLYSSKIAILLIYQPNGLSASTFLTCQYLLDNNYAVLAVINGEIRKTDFDRLRTSTWSIIRRDNFGYDFGGYQDAIWYLKQHNYEPDALLIMNDSIWLPVHAKECILKKMESASSEITGALQLEAYRSDNRVAGTKPPFFGSFLIHLKASAYQHAEFSDFWQNYRATSNKYMTIRRGERGFSRTMMSCGISHHYIFSRRMFDAWVSELDNEGLAAVLNDLVSMVPEHEHERLRLLSALRGDHAWRDKALNLAFKMTEKQNILSSAPIASLGHFGVSYIKKSADPHNLRALALIAKYHQQGSLMLSEIIYEEICEVLHRHGVDWRYQN
jgi:hypothetical protein